MLLNDNQITHLARFADMITPFEPEQVRKLPNGEKCISYGLSSAGYDMRLGCDFKLPSGHPLPGQRIKTLDPKTVTEQDYDFSHFEEGFLIMPGHCILGTSVEEFRIPEDVHCLVVGKSTYARLGIHVLTTPAEPGWYGKLTIEIANLSGLPVKIYPNEGICQMLFFKLESRPKTTYRDREGKYNGQTTTTIARI